MAASGVGRLALATIQKNANKNSNKALGAEMKKVALKGSKKR